MLVLMIGGGDSQEPTKLTRQQLDEFLVQQLPWLRAMVRLNGGAQLRDQESCSDLVQTVCRQLLERGVGVEYRDEKSLRSWLFTAVLNKIRDRHRYWGAARRVTPGGDDAPSVWQCYASIATPSQHAMAHERAAAVEAAFDALPDQYREVITLSRLVGVSHQDIGVQLGKTEANVRMLLSRALARLTTLLEVDEEH